jgi:hypothetical protein
MKTRRRRPNAGVVIAVVALVFAMTGAAVAAKDLINSNDIAKRAVTGKKIARDAVKSGKILNGKIKAKDLADGVVPDVPAYAYGRVNKGGANPAPAGNSVGITGVAGGGAGVICYDLAKAPVSGSATVVSDAGSAGATVSMLIGSAPGCTAPYNDAQTTTTSAPTVGTSPYQEGSPANLDVYVEFIGG